MRKMVDGAEQTDARMLTTSMTTRLSGRNRAIEIDAG